MLKWFVIGWAILVVLTLLYVSATKHPRDDDHQ